MKFACIGIRPEEALASFPTLDLSSSVFFEDTEECLKQIGNLALDILLVRTIEDWDERNAFYRRVNDTCPGIVILDVDPKNEDMVLVKQVSRENLDETLHIMISREEPRQKEIYIRTFGRFVVLQNGRPCSFSGKAKEILALLVTRRGKEVSNEEIYTTLWENRPYSNRDMIVYFNALRRLKKTLKKYGMEDLLISGAHGQMINTEMFDCDYYEWLSGRSNAETGFEEDFLSEYSWGEYILSDMLGRMHK